MTGWTYKEITTDDLKFPLVYGEGKRSRLLATIGVTRWLQTYGPDICVASFHLDCVIKLSNC